MRSPLWINAGVGVAAAGNAHCVTWQSATRQPTDRAASGGGFRALPENDEASSAIGVTLWPRSDGVGASFYRAGPIRRCGSGALAAAAALHHWTGANAGTLHTACESLHWRIRAGDRFSITALPLALRPYCAPAPLARQVPDASAWYCAGGASDYCLTRLPDRQSLARLRLDGGQWSATTDRALIAIAPGGGQRRYYLRYFAPQYGTPEDALTGSAHLLAAALWRAERACGRQLSAAGGVVWTESAGRGVTLTARCQFQTPPPHLPRV